MTDELSVPLLEIGIYEHYKGGRYEVIGVALHSEDLSPLVVYRPLYETTAKLWVRPYEMFIGTVTLGEKIVPRFQKIDT